MDYIPYIGERKETTGEKVQAVIAFIVALAIITVWMILAN